MILLLSIALANPWNANEGPEADELLRLDGRNQWVSARNKAEELLRARPESYTAHHVLGRAFWMGEGDYARAAFHMRKALDIYEQRYEAQEDPPWRLESEGWYSLRLIVGDMGDFEGELRLIEQYNAKQEEYEQRFEASYRPFVAERGWPLMKLERYDEAKMWANRGISSSREWQKSLGWNVLCAVSGEQSDREASIRNCESALFHAREIGAGVAIDASNASNAAFGVFDFDRAETYAIEATKSGDGSTVSAWINLVALYLMEGRGTAVVSAMQGLNQSLASEEPHMRAQKRADVDAVFSLVLLAAGKTEKAFEKIDRALKYPDRRGTISTSEEQSRGSHTCIRYVARKMLQERESERVAALGWWARLKHWWRSLFDDPELLFDAAGVRNALGDEERLVATFRPYLDKGLTGVPWWLTGEIVEILGPGVTEGALRKAQQIDNYSGIEGYYESLLAEIAYRRGNKAEVLQHAAEAQRLLPSITRMTKARMMALEGWALGKQGDWDGAVRRYAATMEIAPSTFRRLGIALPTRFLSTGGVSGQVATALRRSPRFVDAGAGFTVRVEEGTTCLLGPMGETIECTLWPEREEQQGEQEYLVSITEAFHEEAFGLSAGLSGAEWNSLDGTTTSSKNAARKRLENLLFQE